MDLKIEIRRGAVVALLIASLPGMAAAQQRRGGAPGQNLDETMVELTDQLNLDEEQAGQIRSLLGKQNAASREMIEEARASGQGRSAFGAMRERMVELREGTNTEIRSILSAEQLALYEEFIVQREKNRPPRRGQGGPPGGGGPRGS